MCWARDARNSIEKRGDLETYSQVRARIVASHVGGPETDWVPESLFESPQKIYYSVPMKYRTPHIIENGTLVIERRWVDKELVTVEVLEALAHVYEQLASTVISFLGHLGISIPGNLEEPRPDVMAPLAMDRALYLSMRDGSPRGFRLYRRELKIASRKKLNKRYGGQISWSPSKEAKTLRDIAVAHFNAARAIVLKDGRHHQFAFFLKEHKVINLIGIDHPDRATKYILMRDLAQLARLQGADGVMLLGEAWTAPVDQIPSSGFAADAEDRGEALLLNALNASGETIQCIAEIHRKKSNPRKVKRLSQTRVHEGDFQFIFAPFQTEWGCLNEAKLENALRRAKELGIE